MPSDQPAQMNLAHAYMEIHEPAKAARAFAAAAALGPLDADTTHDRALALLQSNDAAGAKRVLDAIPQQSRDDATEELAGEVEERLGNYRQAEEHFSQAAHLNPSEPNIYAWVVELLRHFSWQPAVKIADYGIEKYPASTRLKAARGIALYADNRYKDAAEVFSALLAADPGNATWAGLLGRNCSLIADVSDAGVRLATELCRAASAECRGGDVCGDRAAAPAGGQAGQCQGARAAGAGDCG